jgi:hypothetical protein
MSDRWEEEKERLVALRAEYVAMFTHLHFMQGLRFAVLAATLPILGALFNYYRASLSFSQFKLLREGELVNIDSASAMIIAAVGLGVLFAVRSIELGIELQTRTIVNRGAAIEILLNITPGVFTALQRRVNLPPFHRITGIIKWGYRGGIFISLVLIVVGIWASTK